ncbi:MAG: deoxyribodipyrimidine photolyase, partial [Chloroflexi bacterium]|nr:deoxyribodipyrimidine photolyase [Chloroflexota bacterium]
MIQSQRISVLDHREVTQGAYVLYWMEASQRVEYNHALEYAIARADELRVPVIVYFGLTADFPEANARHYRFMLEGLREVEAALMDRGIGMVIRRESPPKGVIALAREACLIVVDRGYLRVQRA